MFCCLKVWAYFLLCDKAKWERIKNSKLYPEHKYKLVLCFLIHLFICIQFQADDMFVWMILGLFSIFIVLYHSVCCDPFWSLFLWCVCSVQVPAYGSSVTAVDSGLLFPLSPAQSTLSCYLQAPNGDSVAGIGVLLPYTSTGMSAHSAFSQVLYRGSVLASDHSV